MDKEAVKRLVAWIIERQTIYNKRQAGKKAPWTNDTILRENKFCNVYREQDKTTVWIADHWRTPNGDCQDLWFAMVVARLFNKPETLEHIGYPVPWKPAAVLKKLKAMQKAGATIFSGAYIVSTNGIAMDKCEYLVERVLNPLWKDRAHIRPTPTDTLASFHARITQYIGIGSFIGAQVVADLKNTRNSVLSSASDWSSWAASGPGSRRGLNRIFGREPETAWSEKTWLNSLSELRVELADNKQFQKARDSGVLPSAIHAQDLQNCLCEFDKYERVRLGQGRMKATYKGGA